MTDSHETPPVVESKPESTERPPPPSTTQAESTAQSSADSTAQTTDRAAVSQTTASAPVTALSDPDQAQVSLPNPSILNGTSDFQFNPTAYAVNGYDMNDQNYMLPQMNFMQTPMMNMAPNDPISADEIALYDRQIRLWGVKAQEKIRSANILLIGLKGLGAEIAKNLVLAGVGTLTILDHEPVADHDLGTQFFVSQEQIGLNRAEAAQPEIQKLNPRVNLFVDPDIVFNKIPEYFSTFDITIATGLPVGAITSINTSCRGFNRKFYAADSQGMYGYIFADLIIHQFTQERTQPNIPTKVGHMETSSRSVINVTEKVENGKKMEVVLKQEEYSPFGLSNLSMLPADVTKTVSKRKKVSPLLSCLRALFDFQEQTGRLPAANQQDLAMYTKLAHDKHLVLTLPAETMRADFLRSFLQNLGSELSPVVAYLGGRLAQDVINVLGQREQPLQNFLLFDGETCSSAVYSLQPVLDPDMVASMGLEMGVNGGLDMSNVDMNGSGMSAAAV